MVYVKVATLRSVLDTLQSKTGWSKQEFLVQVDATAPTFDRWYDAAFEEVITRSGASIRAVRISLRHYKQIVETYRRELNEAPVIIAHIY